jgi:hypothetical protein
MPDFRDTGSKGACRSWDEGCRCRPSGATALNLTAELLQPTARLTGLAIDLGGSFDQRCRPEDVAEAFGVVLRRSGAAGSKGGH